MKLRANESSAEAALQQARDERLQVGLALEQHIARRQELAEAPQDYAANESKIRELHAELERCEIVIVKRQVDVEEANREAALASYRGAWKAVEVANEAAVAESEKLAKHLRAAESSAGKLEALRKALNEQLAAARELRPSDVESLPRLPDEPDWPGLEQLRHILAGGPRQPVAAAAAARERQARESAQSADAVIQQAVRDALVHGSWDRLARFGPEYRQRALALADREAKTLLTEPGPSRQREVIERRLERIRELAVAESPLTESTSAVQGR